MTDYSRFRKVTLTRDLAAQTGHIAWIEDDQPARAIKRMFEGVTIAPFNCAVWADAYTPSMLCAAEMIAIWRQRFHHNFKGDICGFHPNENIKGLLVREFGAASQKPSPDICPD